MDNWVKQLTDNESAQWEDITGIPLDSISSLESFNLRDKALYLGIKLLCSVLLNLSNLTHLDLSTNNIDSEEMELLSATIYNLSNLTYLDLGYNNIGDEGAKRLAEALEHNNTLTALNLHGEYHAFVRLKLM